jgi:hypothetical protein
MIRVAFSSIAVCLCLFAPIRAQADTINLFDGSSVVYGPPNGVVAVVHFVGDRGFRFDGAASAISGVLVPWIDCSFGGNCTPGVTLSLRAEQLDNDLPGKATLDGVFYPDVGGTSGHTAHAFYEFTGEVILPPFGQSPTAILTVPVGFSGAFDVDQGSQNQLIASASATLTLQEGTTALGIPTWVYQGIRYDLAPVPEPTTLALVGTALAVVGAVAVVRSRNKHNGTRDTISRK